MEIQRIYGYSYTNIVIWRAFDRLEHYRYRPQMDTLLRWMGSTSSHWECSIIFDFWKKILAAHWLRACIPSSQNCIHLGTLTVLASTLTLLESLKLGGTSSWPNPSMTIWGLLPSGTSSLQRLIFKILKFSDLLNFFRNFLLAENLKLSEKFSFHFNFT